jgi:nitrate reductase gamma subunit
VNVLLIGVPYASMVVFVAGLIWRYRSRFTISSLSSQVLESRWLVWGSIPFHLGIVLLFLGHLIPLIAPAWWQTFVSNRTALLAVESIGSATAMLCLIGLVALFIRRVSASKVRASSTFVDVLVLAILISQIALGLAVATTNRWGAIWSVSTTTPYLWSVVTLRPDPALVAGVKPLMLYHLTGAWIVLALIPFTRLVHMMALPLGYLVRPPQKVVWLTARRKLVREELPAEKQPPAPTLVSAPVASK